MNDVGVIDVEVPSASDPPMIPAVPVLMDELLVLIPPTDPKWSIPLEVMPKVVPKEIDPTDTAPVIKFPLPRFIDGPFTVIPSGADNLRTPVEVMPKVVPRATSPVVIKFPLPVLMDELLVVIPPTEPS